MSPTIGKTIFIVFKVLILIAMMLLGVRAHHKMKQRNNYIISLFVGYLLLLVLISVNELFLNYISILFVIFVFIFVSQIY